MTREEAINQLKINKQDYTYMMDDDAVDMAIKALEQEPCVDCVSKQAVIKAVDSHTFDTDNGLCLDDISCILDALPSVTPTRKKGKWIGHGEHCENLGVIPSGLGAYEWCSNCDCGIDVSEWHRNYYNYCPNCGAEMIGSEPEIKNCDNCTHHTDADEIHGITPCGSCGAEKKNFEQKTEMESEE